MPQLKIYSFSFLVAMILHRMKQVGGNFGKIIFFYQIITIMMLLMINII